MSKEKIQLQPSEKTRLEKLMMCSVSERYAIMYAAGVPHTIIANTNLNLSTPSLTADKMIEILSYYYQDEEELALTIITKILSFPLPLGIPD